MKILLFLLLLPATSFAQKWTERDSIRFGSDSTLLKVGALIRFGEGTETNASYKYVLNWDGSTIPADVSKLLAGQLKAIKAIKIDHKKYEEVIWLKTEGGYTINLRMAWQSKEIGSP